MRKTLAERFWEKVDKSAGAEGCWLWTGATYTSTGYGQITIKKRPYGAHRISYLLHFGTIPDKLFVCHHCDNPLCINPSHLFLGTHADNMRDMNSKGRNGMTLHPELALYGEQQKGAKLTNSQVREIRKIYDQGDIGTRPLAHQYGVSRSCIQFIIQRKSWTRLLDEGAV
jgi:hypothetical protein